MVKLQIMNFRLWNLNSEIRTPKSELQRFTLIEIIVVIVILSIVSGISIKFVVDSLRIYTMTVNQKTLFDEGKLAMERMCRDIRDAKSITTFTAGPPGSITFVRNNATVYDAGLPGNTTGETIIFQQNAVAGTLEKVKSSPSASTTTMAEHVTSFTVTNATNEIQLVLTLQSTFGSDTMAVTLQTKVYPKNLLEDTAATPFIRTLEYKIIIHHPTIHLGRRC